MHRPIHVRNGDMRQISLVDSFILCRHICMHLKTKNILRVELNDYYLILYNYTSCLPLNSIQQCYQNSNHRKMHTVSTVSKSNRHDFADIFDGSLKTHVLRSFT